MAWRAKETISSPRGTCPKDEIPRGFPATFLRECIADGSLYDDGTDNQDEPELVVGDILDGMSRKALLEVIAINDLPIRVMKSWTDPQVRQSIRDIVADIATLRLNLVPRTGDMALGDIVPK